ncbi:hypothetical protein IMG5_197280, partial [Ichthyophthirius multifiliis]
YKILIIYHINKQKIYKMSFYNKFLFFIILINEAFSARNLKMIQMAIRHGARYANNPQVIKDKPEYKFNKQKRGQLTSVGMLQHYNLGNLMRQEYIVEKQLLSDKYEFDSVFAFSSNVNRTLQSLQSFLFGLYPLRTGLAIPDNLDADLQQAPYYQYVQQQRQQKTGNFIYDNNLKFALPEGFYPYVIQQDTDNHSILQFICKPSKAKLKAESVKENTGKLEEFYKQFEKQVQEIGAKVNINYTLNVSNVSAFIDWVTSQRYLGITYNITLEEYKLLNYIKTLYKAIIYFTPLQTKLILTPYFRFLLKQFESKINNQNTYKITIASTHDTQLQPLMAVFKLMSNECLLSYNLQQESETCQLMPIFASNFVFELYEDDQDKQHYVKVKFNGKYINICNGQDTCVYNDFKALLTEYIQEDYSSYCDDQCLPQDKQSIFWQISFWILLAIILIILVVYLYKIRNIFRKNSVQAEQIKIESNQQL